MLIVSQYTAYNVYIILYICILIICFILQHVLCDSQ